MSTSRLPRTGRLRIPLLVVGIVAFVVGVGTILSPVTAQVFPTDALVELFGNDYLLLAMFAAGAIAAVLAVLVARGLRGISQASPPQPENLHNAPILGKFLDEALEGGGSIVGRTRHDEVRTRLREAAVTTVMRVENCTRAEAIQRVDQGTWTDDTEAARFLAGAGTASEPPEQGPPPGRPNGGARGPPPGRASESRSGIAARIRAVVGGETAFERQARRTARAIVRHDPGDSA